MLYSMCRAPRLFSRYPSYPYALAAAVLVSPFFHNPVAAQGDRKRVAVVDFAERGQLTQPDTGKLVAELMTSRLSDKYDAIERLQLVRILDEQDLTTTDIVHDADVAVRIGRIAKIHMLIVGTIGKLGRNIIITGRLVDCTTGKIIAKSDVIIEHLDVVPRGVDVLLSRIGLLDKSVTSNDLISSSDSQVKDFEYAQSLYERGKYTECVDILDALISSDTSISPAAMYWKCKYLFLVARSHKALEVAIKLSIYYPGSGYVKMCRSLITDEFSIIDGKLREGERVIEESQRLAEEARRTTSLSKINSASTLLKQCESALAHLKDKTTFFKVVDEAYE